MKDNFIKVGNMGKRKFSDEYLIECLKSYIEDNDNEVPTRKEFENYNKQVAIAISNRWNWNQGIIKAGFQPKNIHVKRYKKFYKANINEMLKMTKEEIDKFLVQNNRLPTSREFEKLDMPYFRFYHEKFNCKYNEFLIEILGCDQEFLNSNSKGK